MFTLTQVQNELTMIIYTTQQIEKKVEAQTAYQYLQNLLDIAKERARPEVVTDEYIETGQQILMNVLTQRAKLEPDFIEYAHSEKEILYLVARARQKIPLSEKPVAQPKKIAKPTVEKLEGELEKAKEKIKQWESGWLRDESLKNKEYRHRLFKIQNIALEKGYDEILKLTAANPLLLKEGREE